MQRTKSFTWLAVAVAAASLFFGSPLPAQEQKDTLAISWLKLAQTDIVTAHGLDDRTLQQTESARFTDEQWRKLFPVAVESDNLVASMELPPMLGHYELKDGAVNFYPRYPFTAGLKYRATLHLEKLPGYVGKPSSLTSLHTSPAPKPKVTTVVEHVYPSAEVLPENLLKFYLHFSAPMSGGHIYEHIHLLNEQGQPVQLPFLEIDEELWNPEMTRLTLFIDPGRIKREVKPLEDIGPALEAGKTFTLVIDSQWRDGRGAPLKESFRKQFKVSPPDRTAPDPKTWRITPGSRGTRQPLTVEFSKPMDHALAQRLIWVTDVNKKHIAGEVTLMDQEKRWVFTPANAWLAGRYELQVQTTIEDLAGNNIGKPFEVDLFEKVEKRIKDEAVSIPFEVP